MKKTAEITSIVLIGLATLGFLFLPQYFDPKIASRNEERELLAFDEDRVNLNINLGLFQYTTAVTQRDHADLFRTLNRSDLAQPRDAYKLESLRGALLCAIMAAQVSRSISDKEEKSLSSQVVNFKSYEEIALRYVKHLQQAMEGTAVMRKRSLQLRAEIRGLERAKNVFWSFCFLLQSLGIVFVVVSMSASDKRESAKPEPATDPTAPSEGLPSDGR